MSEEQKSVVTAELAELFQKYVKAEILQVSDPDGCETAQVVAVSGENGIELLPVKKFVDEWRTRPECRAGTAELSDIHSFVEFVNRFKDEHSVVFADCSRNAPSLTAVIDYHEMGYAGSPRFGKHRAVYRFPVSDEWKLWNDRSGVKNAMGQAQFAEFIEDHIADVSDPTRAHEPAKEFAHRFSVEFATASKLLEVSRTFAVHVGMRTKHHLNPSNGEVSMAFEAEHTETITVPRAFLLAIPVFKHGDRFQICARLRYRTTSGETVWFYDLYRSDETFDHCLEESMGIVKAATKLPMFRGAQEK